MQNVEKSLGLYIHIPFCKSKCFYCDFNSFACRDDYIPAYFNALKKELILWSNTVAKEYRIKTIFIGGGTPSLVNAHYIYEIIGLLRQLFDVENAEISIETNPGTLTYEKLMAYRISGINRLSIGLQASQNGLLKSLGRIHTVQEFDHNYNTAKKVGFGNINIDLIFGIPGQTPDEWRKTLEYVVGLEPSHLSCYSMKIEEGTVFGDRLESGELIPIDDYDDRDMYWWTVEYLNKRGYKHYEISNFSKEGYECRHNLIYWNSQEYIGFGAGAHSFFNNERFNNICDIKQYIDSINGGKIPKEEVQFITEKERISEYIILGLRLVEGIELQKFKERFQKDILIEFDEQISNVVNRGYAVIDKGFLRLTPKGLDFANQVFMEFI